MKKLTLYLAAALTAFSLFSCSYTRTEEDVYTITTLDTLKSSFAKNAPGNRDNGIVFPSSRTFEEKRDLIQYDSVVTREYPDFIRLGLFESVGLIGSASDYKLGTGIFGCFPDFNKPVWNLPNEDNPTFSGGIYRFGVYEGRLRWFQDAPNWTIGTSFLEILAPDAKFEDALVSFAPLYFRKRIYLRDKIPYVSIAGAAGFGWYPSQYANLSASLEVGSIGGANLRFYLGFAAGTNHASSIVTNNGTATVEGSVTSAFPYAGLGVSVLDFVNLPEETEKEWKDYEHSSWEVGLLDWAWLGSGEKVSIFTTRRNDTGYAIKGMNLRLANAKVVLPILDNGFYLGTSLINVLALGDGAAGIGVLPIRAGYWRTLLTDELSIEPFAEYNYYPSSFFNLGVNLNAAFSRWLNMGLVVGYAAGNGADLGEEAKARLGDLSSFSGYYFGVRMRFLDKIFFERELRYNKK